MNRAEARALIDAERRRQIEEEGWSREHDDQHGDGELLQAAMCYLHHGTELAVDQRDGVPVTWPWEPNWWRPRDRQRNLVRAGALLMAERERLERKGLPGGFPVSHVDHKLDLCISYLVADIPAPIVGAIVDLPPAEEPVYEFRAKGAGAAEPEWRPTGMMRWRDVHHVYSLQDCPTAIKLATGRMAVLEMEGFFWVESTFGRLRTTDEPEWRAVPLVAVS